MKCHYNISQNLQSLYHETGTNTKKLLDYVVGCIYKKDRTLVEELQYQRDVDKATWGLRVWEQELGIPFKPDDSITTRRNKVLAKLNSNKRFLLNDLKVLASRYSQGCVSIEEIYDKFYIVIHFEGSRGEPENIEEFISIIDEMLPAHITYDFVFYYNTWENLDSFDKTWGEWDDLDLTWEEIPTYNEGSFECSDQNKTNRWLAFNGFDKTWSEWDALNLSFRQLGTYKLEGEDIDG